jgi:hypothetical protein
MFSKEGVYFCTCRSPILSLAWVNKILFISSPRCIILKKFAKITGRYLYISFEAPKRKRKSRVCDSYWSTMRPYAVMKMDPSMELKTSS